MRVNRQIRADKVRVIDDKGNQVGILALNEALDKARQANQDLVEIAPNARPPVCKIIDYGKFRYRQAKREKETKKASHQVKIKEVKFKPNIDEHDLMTKLKRIREFIGKGFKVRITCMFRGREMLHMDLGRKLLDRICEEVADIANVEMKPKVMGRIMTILLAPLGKSSKSKPVSEKTHTA